MEMSNYQSLKLFILDFVNLSKDAIHIHIGMVVFVCAVMLWKKGKVEVSCLIPVFFVATSMEVLDLKDNWQSLGYMQWSASFHDIVNTTFWPVITVFLAKFFRIRFNKKY